MPSTGSTGHRVRHTGTYIDTRAGRVTFREYAEHWRSSRVDRPSSVAHVEPMLRRHVHPRVEAGNRDDLGDRVAGRAVNQHVEPGPHDLARLVPYVAVNIDIREELLRTCPGFADLRLPTGPRVAVTADGLRPARRVP
jgi:hypothetical protein